MLSRWLPEALNNPNFARYASGSIFNTSSFWIQRLCFGWLAWDLTGSGFWVGLVAFLLFFPVVLFGPFFGVLADRIDRQRAAATILKIAVVVLSLLALTTIQGWLGIELLCLFAACVGVIASAYSPIRMSMIAGLVKREELASAIATGAIIFNLSRLLGPAIAGVIINFVGVGAAIVASVLMVIPLILVLPTLVFRDDRSGDSAKRGFSSLVQGLGYIRRNKKIIHFLWLSATISFFGRGVLELLPAFADGVFQYGSSGLAMMTGAAGIGAIVAGLMLSRMAPDRFLMVSLGSVGVTIFLFSFATAFWYGLLLVMLLGMTITLCGAGTQTLVQILVDDNYRGRVMSVWGVVAFGGTALGGLIIGLLSAAVGLGPATTIAGSGCVLGAIALSRSVVISGSK